MTWFVDYLFVWDLGTVRYRKLPLYLFSSNFAFLFMKCLEFNVHLYTNKVDTAPKHAICAVLLRC